MAGKGTSSKPKVSIVSISYNQEKYIKDALESFVTQETDFDYEVIIGDDASTDNTPKIIEAYAQKYPNIIQPILRKKNIGVVANLNGVMGVAKGEYVALCEGDDYWTDPTKLKRQVDFLDTKPDYALCFHPVRVFFENGDEEDKLFPEAKSGFTLERLLERNFIQTNSVMYRRQDYSKLPDDILPLDWYYHVYHAKHGKIGFINRIMSDYRKHPSGVWWDSNHNRKGIWQKYGVMHMTLFIEFLKLCSDNPVHRTLILRLIARMLNNLIETDEATGGDLVKQVLKKHSVYVEDMLIAQYHLRLNNQQPGHDVSRLSKELKEVEHELRQRNKELEQIKNSKLWKVKKILPR